MGYNCSEESQTALTSAFELHICFGQKNYSCCPFWIPPLPILHCVEPCAGMAVGSQLCDQGLAALAVSLTVFEAGPSGKRIFSLKDDIFRDLIF